MGCFDVVLIPTINWGRYNVKILCVCYYLFVSRMLATVQQSSAIYHTTMSD